MTATDRFLDAADRAERHERVSAVRPDAKRKKVVTPRRRLRLKERRCSMASKIMLVVLGVGLFAAGCSDGSGGPEPTGRAPSAIVAARLDGTFDFDLEASDVATTVRATCLKQSSGDAAKAAACFDDVRKEARDEKVRFTTNAEKQIVYTSLGLEAGKEEIYVEAPITLTRGAEEHMMVAKAAAFPRGSFVSRVSFALHDLPIEAPDANTVILTDPSKGRLVYRRH
jgi:hypothetical protein